MVELYLHSPIQGRLQGCAACAAAQDAERVGAPSNFKVIHHAKQTFFGGIDSSRRKGAFARGKVQDGSECQRNM
jgi:hypothetical protein